MELYDGEIPPQERLQRSLDARARREKETLEAAEAIRREEESRREASVQEWERSMEREADEGGGLVAPQSSNDCGSTAVRLPAPKKLAALPQETEALLNGLIAECAALLHDVAFRSACLTPDVGDRLRFLTAAQSLARTGAKVGETIVRLRGGAQAVETHRHELVYTHVAPLSLPPHRIPEINDQPVVS